MRVYLHALQLPVLGGVVGVAVDKPEEVWVVPAVAWSPLSSPSTVRALWVPTTVGVVPSDTPSFTALPSEECDSHSSA